MLVPAAWPPHIHTLLEESQSTSRKLCSASIDILHFPSSARGRRLSLHDQRLFRENMMLCRFERTARLSVTSHGTPRADGEGTERNTRQRRESSIARFKRTSRPCLSALVPTMANITQNLPVKHFFLSWLPSKRPPSFSPPPPGHHGAPIEKASASLCQNHGVTPCTWRYTFTR